MSLFSSIKRHVVGITCELLTLKDPYDKYEKPRLISETKDCHGHVVQQTIRASNHRDATRHLDGTTIQGNRSIVASKIAPRTYDVHIENWDTEQKGRGMIRSTNYDANAWSEDYAEWVKRMEDDAV